MIKMVNHSQFFIVISLVIISFTFSRGATLLPDEEVTALQEIAKTIGKTDWNFNVDPCSGEMGWRTPNPFEGFENALTCDCTFLNNTVCHVVSIVLKSQSLQGVLPVEIVKLPYLTEIDLVRNFLNGSIPPEWGTTKLTIISLLGNRLTGSIPKEIGNISTLESFVVDSNRLSGVVPFELGNLPNIKRILLSSNNFSGELPETFAKLTTLTDFRINDNRFTGKIPTFCQNWTLLVRLEIQASGMEGPIPYGISLLHNLTNLRISDLNGNVTETFPPLNSMKNLTTVILRSCNIIGQLPDYLGQLTGLQTLDVSFNKLNGTIPSAYSSLVNLQYVYFTGNILSGAIPDWILMNTKLYADISYNNVTSTNPDTLGCKDRLSGIVSCLRSFQCPQNYTSFHINCGGIEVPSGNIKYEENRKESNPSMFYKSRSNWAFSNTGHFLDGNGSPDDYISLTSNFNVSELYKDARLSPNSLTYYGLCLVKGNYTVSLHFAEIMFTDDKTYKSLGRRVFDIYIQGVLVLKDFNIADNVLGAGKEWIERLPAVVTSNNILAIRFQWAGKGTTGIPYRGVYGPLISAISVNPGFDPPANPPSKFDPPKKNSSVSAVVVVGTVAAVVAVILLIVSIFWWRRCMKKKMMESDRRGLDLQVGSFTLRQIKAATNNFDPENKIGEGGFGSVYKGLLADGQIIAVKQLSSKSNQGNREFVNEIGTISALQHPHLVKLYGCCIEGKELLLVYEYMENNSLAHALFGTEGAEETQLNLDWKTRQKICIGIARGLAYLHEESRLKIVHRDIKASNVLLDKDLSAKISDFGLAKLDEVGSTHISTRIAGTFGYMAPEYAMRGYLTDKADVYSFGVVALEIVSGRSNISSKSKSECIYLLDWALQLKKQGKLMELVDPKLGTDYNKEEVMVMIRLALLCTNASAAVRPAMSAVVGMLEGKIAVADIPITPADSDLYDEMDVKQFQKSVEQSLTESEIHTDGPWTAASSTGPEDLYPAKASQYLQGRD